jgi:threonyl-tRNA synthetase
MGKKIRAAKNMKLPYFLVIGDAEIDSNTVTVESRDTGQSTSLTIMDFLMKLNEESNV